MEKIGEVMGPLFGEVYGCIQQSGQEPAGMPFAIYHSMDGETVDLECGMPVASPMDSVGRVQAGELPAGTVATATHMGPYDALRQTWAALTEWMSSQGLQTRGRALGSLRHRPQRRARPVEVAHRYLLSRVLIGGAPTLPNEPADCLDGRGSFTDNRGNHKGLPLLRQPLLNWSSVELSRDNSTLKWFKTNRSWKTIHPCGSSQ